MIKIKYLFILMNLAFTLHGAPSFGLDLAAQGAEPFDITEAPSANDWRHFMAMTSPKMQELWDYQKNRQKLLADWHWAWRLAWIRVSKDLNDTLGLSILKAGLFDRALVVRAAAATAFGHRYAASVESWPVNELAKAYDNPHNLRSGEPLMVQFRILYALNEIGSSHASQTGDQLSRSHSKLKSYWQKLAHPL